MLKFQVNTERVNPFPNFKFLVRWDGQVVAAVSKVSALKRTTEVISHREGGDVSTQRHSPGKTKFEPITLERGITFANEFESWANLVYSGDGMSLANFRKNIALELLNEAQQVVMRYNVYRCWVSEYVALPELDANANGVAFEHIILQNEGYERDPAVVEVPEP